MKQKLQELSKVMMIPVILLIIAAICIGIGSAFVDLNNVEALKLTWLIQDGNMIHSLLKVINDLGFMVIKFLPVFFVVAISFGLSKKEKGWGALAGIVLFIAMHTVINTLLGITGINAQTTSREAFMASGMSEVEAYKHSSLYGEVLGVFSYDINLFGAIVVGVIASFVHNRFINTELPTALSFCGGAKASMVMIFATAIGLGFVMYFIWPMIGFLLCRIGQFIGGSGLIGTFTFGAVDKALLPLGLHHLIAFPIEYTRVGGVMEVGGTVYEGVNNIRMAQMGDPETVGYLIRNFTTGRVIIHFAILPGATLAMYKMANDNKKRAVSVLIPAIATALLVGITEPIEYTFLFAAPCLYFLIYVPMAGLTYVFTELFEVSIMGESMRNIFPNLLQPQKVDAMPLLFLIPIFFVVTYFIFAWTIKKFDIKTPGRKKDNFKSYSKKEYREKIEVIKVGGKKELDLDEMLIDAIIEGIGGAENIESITNCAIRLRVEVKNTDIFYENDYWVKQIGASGVIKKNKSIQIVLGTRVISIVSKIKLKLNEEAKRD